MSSPASDKKFTTEGESESSLIRMLEELPEHVGSSAAKYDFADWSDYGLLSRV